MRDTLVPNGVNDTVFPSGATDRPALFRGCGSGPRYGAMGATGVSVTHRDKYFRNLIKSTRNQIIFTIFPLS